MAIKRFNVVASTGTYTDAEGVEKRRYMNCGVVFENEKGLLLKLESMPIGSNGWFYLFEPDTFEQRESQGRRNSERDSGAASSRRYKTGAGPKAERVNEDEAELLFDEAPPF